MHCSLPGCLRRWSMQFPAPTHGTHHVRKFCGSTSFALTCQCHIAALQPSACQSSLLRPLIWTLCCSTLAKNGKLHPHSILDLSPANNVMCLSQSKFAPYLSQTKLGTVQTLTGSNEHVMSTQSLIEQYSLDSNMQRRLINSLSQHYEGRK